MILKIDGFCYLLCLTELSGNDDESSFAETTHVSEEHILLFKKIYMQSHAVEIT